MSTMKDSFLRALLLKRFDHIQVPNHVLVVSDSKSTFLQGEDEVGNQVQFSMAMVNVHQQGTLVLH